MRQAFDLQVTPLGKSHLAQGLHRQMRTCRGIWLIHSLCSGICSTHFHSHPNSVSYISFEPFGAACGTSCAPVKDPEHCEVGCCFRRDTLKLGPPHSLDMFPELFEEPLRRRFYQSVLVGAPLRLIRLASCPLLTMAKAGLAPSMKHVMLCWWLPLCRSRAGCGSNFKNWGYAGFSLVSIYQVPLWCMFLSHSQLKNHPIVPYDVPCTFGAYPVDWFTIVWRASKLWEIRAVAFRLRAGNMFLSLG